MSLWDGIQALGQMCVSRVVPEQCTLPLKHKPRATSLPQKDEEYDVRFREVAANRRSYILEVEHFDLPPFSRCISLFDLGHWPGYATPFVRFPRSGAEDRIISSFEALERMYHLHRLRLPPMSKIWNDDIEFGRQRLVGITPTAIQRIMRLPPNLFFTSETIEGLLDDDDTLLDALAGGRIFLVDYTEKLKDIELSNGSGYLSAPACLLYLSHQRSDNLLPVAIQLNRERNSQRRRRSCGHNSSNRHRIASREYELVVDISTTSEVAATEEEEEEEEESSSSSVIIVTPNDNMYAWNLAKLHFQCAEHTWHFFGIKILTHMLSAMFATSVYRCLSSRHPIRQMLAPHLLSAIQCNNWILDRVLISGGLADQLFVVGLEGGLKICRRAMKNFLFSNAGFEGDLRNRNMTTTTSSSNVGYHYGEDGLLVWNAIQKYVRSVVELHYTVPSDITNDTELSSWVSHLKEHLPSIPFLQEYTVDPLVSIPSVIIWILTAGHSALNSDTYNVAGWVPNRPFWISLPWLPKPLDKFSEKDILASLPTEARMLGQAQFALQSSREQATCPPLRRQNMKNSSEADVVFADQSTQGLYLSFVERLANIQTEIEIRNNNATTDNNSDTIDNSSTTTSRIKRRPIPYVAFLPSTIARHMFV